MDAIYLSNKFASGRNYVDYVATGTADQQMRWRQMYDAVQLTSSQRELVATWTREMRLLVVSGVWCGDCIQQVPHLAHIAEANPGRVLLRLVDRDEHRDLAERLRINTGDRVPVVLFLAEDHEWCATYGDRTLSRYRALARRQLGSSCPTGLVLPEAEEITSIVQDWLNECERVQLMLRLSGRLRQRHND